MSAVGSECQPRAVRRPVRFAVKTLVEGEARRHAARGVPDPDVVVSAGIHFLCRDPVAVRREFDATRVTRCLPDCSELLAFPILPGQLRRLVDRARPGSIDKYAIR